MDNAWSLEACGKSDEEGVDVANGKRFGEPDDFGKNLCEAGTFCRT